jgi:hypothetical protein
MSDSLVIKREDKADAPDGPIEDKQSLDGSADTKSWSRSHDVDFRLTIPLFVRDYYIAFVAGTERRTPERRSAERRKHPLLALGNIAFLIGIGFCIWIYTKAITNWLTIIAMSN